MTRMVQVHKDDFTSHDDNNDGLLTLTEVAELLEHQLGRPGPCLPVDLVWHIRR